MTGSRSTSSSSNNPDLLEVGWVARAHGLKGDVIVALSTNRPERVAPGTVLHTDRGDLVVARSQPHQDRWLVRFEGVNSREAADALRATSLRAEPLDDPEALWAHELIGATVVDQHGVSHGEVQSLELNPAADLLVLPGGGLVPLTFVVSFEDGVVTVDVPDGLLPT